jgi:glycosyltransferase involved in cell wall biosynthesis
MPGVTDIVSAVIPCLGEEDAIGAVVASVVAQGVAEVIVVDGASRDRTVERATAAGARVVIEPRRGLQGRDKGAVSDRLLAETKCTHESPPVRGYSQ